MMNYHLGQGPDRNWLVAETEFDSRYQGKCEAIFSQGNGYLGQPGYAGGKLCRPHA